MTVQEKAKMLMSLIAHNERMYLTLREKPLGVTDYTEALRHGLYCIAQVHGLDEPLVAWMARPWYTTSTLICLRGLRGYHQSGLMRDSGLDGWMKGEDAYLEAIEEAIECVEKVCGERFGKGGDDDAGIG